MSCGHSNGSNVDPLPQKLGLLCTVEIQGWVLVWRRDKKILPGSVKEKENGHRRKNTFQAEGSSGRNAMGQEDTEKIFREWCPHLLVRTSEV